MKKGLLYYCLVISLVIHLLIIFAIRLENFEKKEKEPIVVDVVGPLKLAPKTAVPAGKTPRTTAAVKPPERVARNIPPRQFRPSFPTIPVPAAPAPAPHAPSPPAGLPSVPGGMAAPSAPGQGGTAKAPAVPQQPQSRGPSVPSAPRRLVPPSEEDLERYAKVDRESLKQHKDDITFDDDDLRYASYLQGLKRRIELIWKYPETAQRDGLQGSLIMKFTIAKSGKVENIELVSSSGYPMLDEAAKQALMDANPFNPLPDNWKKETFTITGKFVYRIYNGFGRGDIY